MAPKSIHTSVILTLLVLALAGFHGVGLASTAPATATQAPAESTAVPKAVIPQPNHRFAPVMEGAEIRHDFIIENRGEAPLEIHKVQPD